MIQEQDENLTPEQLAVVQADRQKKGLALATGNPLDKVVTNPQEVDKKQVQTEETLIERVINIMQRRKRALAMKRRKPRIVRARDIKKTRLATQDQLMRRAMRMAKTMLRKRAAGARGANYNKLSPAQKMNIDRQIEPKAKNIKAMATRMMPRVKAGEMRRLNAVRTHKSTKGVYGNLKMISQSHEPVFYSKLLGEKITKEDLNAMFTMYEGKLLSAITAPVRVAAKTAIAGAAVAHALSTPQNTAAAAGGLAAYGLKKLSGLGKYDPEKAKKQKSDKHTETMNQQALIQSKERTKQAQLKTKQMMQKPATPATPKPSSVSGAPAPKPQTQSAPKQKPSSAPTQQTSPKPASAPAPSAPAPSAPQQPANTSAQQTAASKNRQQKQAAAGKIARQQMGLVNHKEWDYESYLQEKLDQHLQKKADKHNTTVEELKLVFEQGLADYVENKRTTPHQFAMQRVNSYLAYDDITIEEGGLWDNIHAKRKRIKAGSGERMRKPGSKGAPTKQNFIDAAESLEESFIVDRAVGYSGVFTAKDLGIKMQGGFALHPSVEEDNGAGFEGTNKLTNKYKKDTPGEAVEAFARMLRAKRKANTPC